LYSLSSRDVNDILKIDIKKSGKRGEKEVRKNEEKGKKGDLFLFTLL